MRVAVGVVTCQREDLLARTLESIGTEADYLRVVDNSPHGTLPALGFARAEEWALSTDADLIVLSPDDFLYHPNWLGALRYFWTHAPGAVALLGHCLLPVFHFSIPCGHLDVRPLSVLLRPVTIAAWSYRREDAELCRIEVAPSGWEKAVCRRVMEAGRLVAELDLAEHIGQDRSSLGHDWSIARPVQPYVERWLT